MHAEYKVVKGKPEEMLTEAARQNAADLIIMGTRGMGKLRRTIMGGVSDYVIKHAHCPVLVCRAKEAVSPGTSAKSVLGSFNALLHLESVHH